MVCRGSFAKSDAVSFEGRETSPEIVRIGGSGEVVEAWPPALPQIQQPNASTKTIRLGLDISFLLLSTEPNANDRCANYAARDCWIGFADNQYLQQRHYE